MPFPNSSRPGPERSLTWPLPQVRNEINIEEPTSTLKSTTPPVKHDATYEADFNRHLEDRFLSPINMSEYEDWASDSDGDDAEEIEWSAGITDFSLFDDDRRHAQETNEPLPDRWNGMLAEQASALHRAVERNRASPNPDPVNRPLLSSDDIPNLTPDTSPSLRDDLDVESFHGQNATRPSVPNYLTVTVTPPDDDEDVDTDMDDNDEPALSFYVARKRERKIQRPGLNYSRTMSGQSHAWRRPSNNMYTLGEDTDAEIREEMCAIRRISSGVDNDDGAEKGDRGRCCGRK